MFLDLCGGEGVCNEAFVIVTGLTFLVLSGGGGEGNGEFLVDTTLGVFGNATF
jgi:hypothetical protein